MRRRFDNDLKILKDELDLMGDLVIESLEKINLILKDFDDKLNEEIKNNEIKVDQLESSIQSRSLKLLCREQPVARDLRDISTAINVITDLERIADQTVDIAEILKTNENSQKISDTSLIFKMTSCCIEMVKKSLDSYNKKDIKIAENVIESDDEVDNLLILIRDNFIEYIRSNDKYIKQSVDFIMIAKYLERIGDHAVNVAEWVIFNITGEHKSHQLL